MPKPTPQPTPEELQRHVDQWRTGQAQRNWDQLVRGVVVDLKKGADSKPSPEDWESLGV